MNKEKLEKVENLLSVTNLLVNHWNEKLENILRLTTIQYSLIKGIELSTEDDTYLYEYYERIDEKRRGYIS